MLPTIEKIITLSKKRIGHLHHVDNRGFYEWYETYIDWIHAELNEAIDEIAHHNSVYLEDELGDVFWDYMCLLHSLEEDGYIDKQKVFARCYKKFSERIWVNGDGGKTWQEVKDIQKQELKEEHEKMCKQCHEKGDE